MSSSDTMSKQSATSSRPTSISSGSGGVSVVTSDVELVVTGSGAAPELVTEEVDAATLDLSPSVSPSSASPLPDPRPNTARQSAMRTSPAHAAINGRCARDLGMVAIAATAATTPRTSNAQSCAPMDSLFAKNQPVDVVAEVVTPGAAVTALPGRRVSRDDRPASDRVLQVRQPTTGVRRPRSPGPLIVTRSTRYQRSGAERLCRRFANSPLAKVIATRAGKLCKRSCAKGCRDV